MKQSLLITILALACASCSIKSFAIDSFASSLSEGPDVFATEDDPQLVRDALPFALKAVEALLGSAPKNPNLLLTACRGYTQYSYAFVQLDAERLEYENYEESQQQKERALKLYLRARDYGLRGLELKHPGITGRLSEHPYAAAAELKLEELPMIFWTASAWGAAIGLGFDRPELLADINVARALIERALALDEGWDNGAIHEAMVVIESFPEAMGGSQTRAREHFQRALQLSGGLSSSLYVTLAERISVPNQDRAEFESLLELALQVDPDAAPALRLSNTISRDRARYLLSIVDDLIL